MGQTACYICGNPCYDWGNDSHSACGPCANEIKKKSEYNHATNPPAQDGFGKSTWAEAVRKAKADWDGGMLRTHCSICGVSCKNWSDPGFETVCASCNNEIHAHRYGSPPTVETDGNGYPTNPAGEAVWKESLDYVKKKFALSKLEAGDRVEIKIFDPSGNINYSTATVVDKLTGENRWLLALDFPYTDAHKHSSAWNSGVYAGKAQALGLDAGVQTFWIVDPITRQSEIERVIEKKNPEQKKPELKKAKQEMVSTWNLDEGDRVKIRIEDQSDPDGEVYVEGTFIKRSNDGDGTAIIALDQEYHSDDFDTSGWYDLDEDGDELKEIASKYPGIKTNRSNLWTAEDSSDSETRIIKVLKKQAPKEEGKTEMKDTKTGREISYGELFKKDMGKAMIRSGTSAGVDGLKAGIRKMLAHDGVGTEGVEAVLKFLEGDFGDALLRAGLGNTLTFMPIPFIQENEYAQQVSEELRVSGLEKGLTKGRKMVQEFIVPSLMEAFASTPLMAKIMGEEEAKQRVAEGVSPKRVAEIVAPQAEELEVVEDPFKASKQAHA